MPMWDDPTEPTILHRRHLHGPKPHKLDTRSVIPEAAPVHLQREFSCGIALSIQKKAIILRLKTATKPLGVISSNCPLSFTSATKVIGRTVYTRLC